MKRLKRIGKKEKTETDKPAYFLEIEAILHRLPAFPAVTKVFDKLLHAADEGDVSDLCLLDLTAAFDTVDHDLMLLTVSYTHLTLPTNREV